jgi:selenocysteine lyase/cysteine desulfurase
MTTSDATPRLARSDRARLFPVTERIAYLSHARRGPLSAPAAEIVKAIADDLMQLGTVGHAGRVELGRHALTAFAGLVGASDDDMSLTLNATDAFERVLAAIDWRPGDVAVAPRNDYPAITRSMLRLRTQGVDVVLVEPDAEGAVSARALLAALSPRARLVATSHVGFMSGYRVDVEALCAECRRLGVLTAIDMVQSAGAMKIDLQQTECDFAWFVGRKWLLSLEGLGILFARRGALARAPEPDPDQRVVGAPPRTALCALGASVALLASYGVSATEAAILDKVQEIRAFVRRSAWRLMGEGWGRTLQSGIVSLRSDRLLDAEQLRASFVASGVSVGVLDQRVLLSPHFYNSDADLARVFDVLNRLS